MITSQLCDSCKRTNLITFPYNDGWRCPYCYYDIPKQVLNGTAMTIEDNIIARSTAKDLIELFDFPNNPLIAEMMIEELQKMHPELKPKDISKSQLTEQQIHAVRNMRFSKGQFEGYYVYQVPRWYIDWWLDEQKFSGFLYRYSLTDTYKRFHIDGHKYDLTTK